MPCPNKSFDKHGLKSVYPSTDWESRRIYIPQWTWSSLVKVIACLRFRATPLPESMQTYYQLDPEGHILIKYQSKYCGVSFVKNNQKCRLQNGDYCDINVLFRTMDRFTNWTHIHTHTWLHDTYTDARNLRSLFCTVISDVIRILTAKQVLKDRLYWYLFNKGQWNPSLTAVHFEIEENLFFFRTNLEILFRPVCLEFDWSCIFVNFLILISSLEYISWIKQCFYTIF